MLNKFLEYSDYYNIVYKKCRLTNNPFKKSIMYLNVKKIEIAFFPYYFLIRFKNIDIKNKFENY